MITTDYADWVELPARSDPRPLFEVLTDGWFLRAGTVVEFAGVFAVNLGGPGHPDMHLDPQGRWLGVWANAAQLAYGRRPDRSARDLGGTGRYRLALKWSDLRPATDAAQRVLDGWQDRIDALPEEP